MSIDTKQKVRLSYLGVVLIWSTTPLAIRWSGEGVEYLLAVTSRMVIGLAICLGLIRIMGLSLAWSRQALKTYVAVSLGIYGAMVSVYWGARFIPSGWISVLFGLTPIVTGLMARRFLDEPALGGHRLWGVILGMAGLVVVFYGSLEFSDHAWLGVAALMLSVTLHSASTVWVKAIGYHAHGLSITTGGLLFSVPAYLLTCWVLGVTLPEQISTRALYSIAYLGVVATVLGFAAFFYVLRHVEASRVALLPLMTPVLALWLGNVFNDEAVSRSVVMGTVLILTGLVLYEPGLWRSFFK